MIFHKKETEKKLSLWPDLSTRLNLGVMVVVVVEAEDFMSRSGDVLLLLTTEPMPFPPPDESWAGAAGVARECGWSGSSERGASTASAD